LKETIQKYLGLAFFVAGDVLPAPGGKFSEFFPARHGEVLPERGWERQKRSGEYGVNTP
jgi:hypothetical protein